MGLFKQMKDMKDMVHAAPDMIDQAMQMKASAEAMQAAQQQQMAAAMGGGMPGMPGAAPAAAPTGADFDPINGVSLELYAEISKGLAAVNYDQSQAPMIAMSKGVMAEDWEAAVAGWNARMKSNPAVGQRFNALYMGRA